MTTGNLTAALDAAQAYRDHPTPETLEALALALTKFPDVWIAAGRTKYRHARDEVYGDHFEEMMETDP